MPIAPLHPEAEQAALAHQAQLTKPPGALGRLEQIAVWLAARQGKAIPDPLKPAITVFAGDHGVCAQGVSVFPSVVTGEMVKNFARGGAAISVLARLWNAPLAVVDVGVAGDLSQVAGVVQAKVAPGSADLTQGPAMSRQQVEAALQVGRAQAQSAIHNGANLLIAGDMGIGNTTASACLICALALADPEDVVGRGTGVDDAGLARKRDAVQRGLARAKATQPADGIDWLAQLGGLEIAAMAGFYLEGAARGVPCLIDGFIAAAAALVAHAIEPGAEIWWLASHASQETGHRLALRALGLDPLVDLQMRLGEGSGAAICLPLLQEAVALHAGMATFAQAGVSGGVA
ncbi:MAG: nicotinate-nucleotide--dimethylbenzimidazole phosphoribosyltransferase [Alphaproteobacteria bacterium CG_4_10_14_0_2_um_filter_63_37]|nr:MAG: nicotinate-nucleotide--dimethylbenzimidazole phosphoribosyltransferase [Proteobacteria bacterium CG1_02_64_396]PJA25541.1 MAG: nicotinate-nucleotide--dimethylbenzimidazole phosphoribosyltransferase [Alphaproteobacteria bacterium CG_4_10_14_0_2_um_filter_63_37]